MFSRVYKAGKPNCKAEVNTYFIQLNFKRFILSKRFRIAFWKTNDNINTLNTSYNLFKKIENISQKGFKLKIGKVYADEFIN